MGLEKENDTHKMVRNTRFAPLALRAPAAVLQSVSATLAVAFSVPAAGATHPATSYYNWT